MDAVNYRETWMYHSSPIPRKVGESLTAGNNFALRSLPKGHESLPVSLEKRRDRTDRMTHDDVSLVNAAVAIRK